MNDNLGLGRRIPTDWKHYEKFPLTAESLPTTPVPVVIGVNWYTDFDSPIRKSDGRWWIGLDSKNLGTVRGGHCVCLEPGDQLSSSGKIIRRLQDALAWYSFYDQGAEGACVGFGSSRMMSLLNRKEYFARWLWDEAKLGDDWSDTNPGDDNGTTVRAALEVLRTKGHVAWQSSYSPLNQNWQERDKLVASQPEGIQAYRWASTVDEVESALKSPQNQKLGAVRVLNSWGTSYPQRVFMPHATLQRLIDEQGEVGLVTDR